MALILAVNPGNAHNPTLSRLARELQGCEIIGAESCAVAIKAIKKRVPDMLLLPAVRARDEADLTSYLRSIPGGVPTLKLPPVETADPLDLARQIRELLTGTPAPVRSAQPVVNARAPREAAPVGASPHLIAAAAATISWIRARREQWSEPLEHDRGDREDRRDRGVRPAIAGFLPRAAAIAVAVGIVGAAVWYWNDAPQPVEISQPPIAGQPAEKPEPMIEATIAVPPPQPVTVVSPFEVTISAGGQPIPLDPQGRAMLIPGQHRLRFQNRERGYDETRTVQVRPTESTTVTLSPETTIRVTSSEPAEVLLDGTRVGDTPYEGKISLGAHAVTVRTAGAERQLTVGATSKPVQLEVDFSKP